MCAAVQPLIFAKVIFVNCDFLPKKGRAEIYPIEIILRFYVQDNRERAFVNDKTQVSINLIGPICSIK